MSRLPQHGDFPAELLEEAKAQMTGELDFAEQQEPLARNLDGRVSAGGFIEQHFNFDEYRVPVAPFSDEEIKKRMKALRAESEKLKKAYPSQVDKQVKIRKQLEDYTRQLGKDTEAAQAAMEQNTAGGDGPPTVARTAQLDEIEKNEPKHGKLAGGREMSSKEFVDLYKKYQDGAYASQVDDASLQPAAKQKATPMTGATTPTGLDDDYQALVAGSPAYWKAATARRKKR